MVAISDGFNNCTGLTDIVFGSASVSIDDGFNNCDGLTNLVFSNGVMYIDGFRNCDGLMDIVIGSCVANIGDASFCACTSLTNISVAADNSVCRDIDGVLFSKDSSILLMFPAGRNGDYAVPDGTACLEQDAFSDAALTSLWLPASVTNAGEIVSSYSWFFADCDYHPLSGGNEVFFNMPDLINISVAVDNSIYRDIGGGALQQEWGDAVVLSRWTIRKLRRSVRGCPHREQGV